MLMINIFVLIIALAVLIFGANKFVDASSNYAAYFGVNEFFIGLTIVALGTSIPELFVAVSAIFNRLFGVRCHWNYSWFQHCQYCFNFWDFLFFNSLCKGQS